MPQGNHLVGEVVHAPNDGKRDESTSKPYSTAVAALSSRIILCHNSNILLGPRVTVAKGYGIVPKI
jgi:hypothetical protein